MRIEVAKLPQKKGNKRELYARVCFYYPQYNLQEAAKLPARDVNLLLKTAKRIEAKRMYDLVQVVAAPNTKKGSGVKKLSNFFLRESK